MYRHIHAHAPSGEFIWIQIDPPEPSPVSWIHTIHQGGDCQFSGRSLCGRTHEGILATGPVPPLVRAQRHQGAQFEACHAPWMVVGDRVSERHNRKHHVCE